MPERGFDTGFWTNRLVEKIPKDGKILLVYLKTNAHCNQAGLYQITTRTMSFETGIEESDLPVIFDTIKEHVVWYKEHDIVWVKDFLKEQAKSSKFIAAAAKCLTTVAHNGIVKEFIDYNYDKYSISIPYQYYIDRLSILTRASVSVSVSSSNNNSLSASLSLITKLYQENIGQITPIVADKLKDIVNEYPSEWFEEALKLAVGANARKLSYIEGVLQRWSVDGFKSKKKGAGNGKSGRNTREIPKEGEYTTPEEFRKEYRDSLATGSDNDIVLPGEEGT